ncbi:hypothetical protein E8E13_004027 [Curvularia kusanoi]|uniref:Uncharacterized protein n=1 Tax=Curvularia kusanoi TaxID=90978 RepID=A0A9P4T5Y5_CURKU|nr:hypothetical protein E8E13_004027 [Curvularia kusanoi]
MNSHGSRAVDDNSYRDDGLSNGIPLRVHREQHLEIQGSLRAQHDWNTSVRPITDYEGGLGNRFNFISVTIPDCLPERLEIISYANEFAFLYDDEMEQLDLKQFQEGRDAMLQVFSEEQGDATPFNETKALDPKKKIQMQIFARMKALDAERAVITMQSWIKFVDLASRTRMEPFETLNQYLPTRAIDAGELLVDPFLCAVIVVN